MEKKQNCYMKTFTGLHIDPLQPKAEEITLRDIAHALSLLCRGNGQTTHFYSVAQHCLNCEKEAEERGYSVRVRLGCLLHDASEAYLSDVIRPIKQYIPTYEQVEEKFLNAVFEKFGIADLSEEEKRLIKEVDDDLLVYDLVELLKEPMPSEGYRFHIVPDVRCRDFQEVEDAYFECAHFLMNAR